MRSQRYRIITPPTEYPLSLGDVKRYSVIEHNDDDPLLIDLINDATDYAQHYMHSQLCSAVYEVFFESFDDCLELPLKPIVSVDAVNYFDEDSIEQLLDSSVYEIDQYGTTPNIVLVDGETWPTVDSRVTPVKITYTAGYGESSNVPGTIRRAIAMLVRHFDENREGIAFSQVNEMPHAITALLGRYRNAQYL